MITVGQRIHGYTLEEVIGEGGMATIYRAANPLGVKRAIKVLKPYYASDPTIRERFEQEAHLMVSLGQHKAAICQVENIDVTDDHLAIVMEYLHGQNLSAYLVEQGAVGVGQLVGWLLPVLDAMGYAHQQQVVHRDIKPANLFLTSQGQLKILDFGIAKVLTAGKDFTKSRQIIGSPAYLSPEQIVAPKTIDHRSDIYSLGVTVWTLLKGHHPYLDDEDTSSDFIVLKKVVDEPLPLLVGEAAGLNAVIQKATAKELSQRYANCQAFAQALQEAIAPPAPQGDGHPDGGVGDAEKTILKRRPGRDRVEQIPPTSQAGQERPPTDGPKPERVDTGAETAEKGTEPKSPKKKRFSWLLAVGALVVLALVAGGYWLYTTSSGYQNKQGVALYYAKDYKAALSLFRTAAEAGNANSQMMLGLMYYRPEGVAKDDKLALSWFRKAADQNHPLAQYYMGAMYENGYGAEQDTIEAKSWYEKSLPGLRALAEDNDPLVLNALGFLNNKGRGVKQDDGQAVNGHRKVAEQGDSVGQKMHDENTSIKQDYVQKDIHKTVEKEEPREVVSLDRKAADQNDAKEQINLGDMYAAGRGVKRDFAEAVNRYRKAAGQGDAIGQAKLGFMYEKGYGVKQDYTEALIWYRKAAEQGDAGAQINLGTMYEAGRGVKQDYTEALIWYRKAAEQGHATGQANLGLMYEAGRGVKQDYTEALIWYRKAAEQGHANAQYNLGYMYANGLGVKQDDGQAVSWYRKAAEQGNAGGQTNLGYMYEYGRGVEQNRAQAVSWYQKAARNGNITAQSNLKRLGESW